MEKKLNQVAQQIQEIHQQNELNAIDLNDLLQRLQILQKELIQPPIPFIHQSSLLLPPEKGKYTKID